MKHHVCAWYVRALVYDRHYLPKVHLKKRAYKRFVYVHVCSDIAQSIRVYQFT